MILNVNSYCSILPNGVTVEKVLDVMPLLGMFVENQWGSLPNLDELRLIDQILKLNNYTVTMAVAELGLVCKNSNLRRKIG